MIRAKFYCSEVSKQVWSQVPKRVDAERVKLTAVVHGEENKAWAEATPNGHLEITITNPEAQGKIEPGKYYFLDIAPVPDAG